MTKNPKIDSKANKQPPGQMKDWEGSSAYVEQAFTGHRP